MTNTITLSNAKPRCLFLNVSDVSLKLFKGTKLTNLFKPIVLDSQDESIDIVEYVNRLNIKNIVVDTSTVHFLEEDLLKKLIELRLSGIKIFNAEDFYEVINKRIPLVKIQSNNYIVDDIFSTNLKDVHIFFKRLFDLFIMLCLLPFALFFVCFGALLVKFSSRGPAFFSQKRVGKNGKIFTIYKLRSMTVHHDSSFTTLNDVRITPVGKFLRKTKIDELPQLLNILLGEMSLIGPRPERPEFVDEYSKENAFFELRHAIKPGVTGWAQVNLPKATPEDNLKKLEYDLYYIKNYSFFLDIRILIETIRVVFTMNSH